MLFRQIIMAIKIRRIPVIFSIPVLSCHTKIPTIVPARGSAVAKMAAFPASRPFKPQV